MGCGRVGSALAVKLEEEGHSVAVLDRDATSFRRLGPSFRGQTVTGVGFDRDRLREAGIERAHAFAAVSSGDNSNILAARVARETFGVENVVARIYDPKRAEIYERLGIPTVATVAWSTGQMLRRLLPEGASEEWRDPSGTVDAGAAVAASGLGRPPDPLDRRDAPAPGSRSSPGTAPGCCPSRTRSCRRATCCTSS